MRPSGSRPLWSLGICVRARALAFKAAPPLALLQAKFLPNSGDSTLAMCARDGQVRVAELSATQCCKNTKRVAQHKGASHKVSPHRPPRGEGPAPRNARGPSPLDEAAGNSDGRAVPPSGGRGGTGP